MKAAYLGPKASFSHQAALKIFHNTSVEAEALHTFADIFEAVQSAEFEYGVVPFENSSNGSVVQLLDLLADRQLIYTEVRVCAEYYLPVHHQLLFKKAEEDGGKQLDLDAALNGIQKFYTHPQAWGQCSTFLSRSACRRIARQDSSSTSEAARVVSENGPETCAAIASDLAGEEYGLVRLAENIEDKGDNTTRFFVVARPGTEIPKSINGNGSKNYKNLVSFTIDHESPGALADALSIFRKHDFNLTSINTRPSRLRPWHYIFLAECEQVRQEGGSGEINSLMADLAHVALSCRHLGSWEDQLVST
jgi:prephenate dehydratase